LLPGGQPIKKFGGVPSAHGKGPFCSSLAFDIFLGGSLWRLQIPVASN
jgi:hypothetical protein